MPSSTPSPMPTQTSSPDRAALGRRPSPDAALMTLAEELLQRAIHLHQHDRGLVVFHEDDYDYEHDEVRESGRALMRMRAATMEGVIAKARFARVQFERAVACDGGETVESIGEHHEVLVWSVLNELLEMNGGLDGLPTYSKEAGWR